MSTEYIYGYELATPFLGTEVPLPALLGLAAG